jgi:catechol 2,3-dioxygenase-like lactoylglutathione lyase family enzyme
MTRLAYLTLHVDDLAESVRFYGDGLGLPILRREDWGVVLDAGGVGLHLHERDPDHVKERVEVTFDVEDADAAVALLRDRGARVLDEVADREWGDRDGAVEDPDGNTVYVRSRGGRTKGEL